MPVPVWWQGHFSHRSSLRAFPNVAFAQQLSHYNALDTSVGAMSNQPASGIPDRDNQSSLPTARQKHNIALPLPLDAPAAGQFDF